MSSKPDGYFFIGDKMYEFPKDKAIFEKYFGKEMKHEKESAYHPAYLIDPKPGYKLRASEYDIQKRLQKEGMSAEQAVSASKDIWKDITPEMYQNIDEWVEGKPLTEIMYGPLNITLNYLMTLWKENTGMDFSVGFFIPKLKKYIRTGKPVGLYPFIL